MISLPSRKICINIIFFAYLYNLSPSPLLGSWFIKKKWETGSMNF